MPRIEMRGFTDIHCHILPLVDDGASNVEQATALIRMAWENGTRTIIFTPHYRGTFKKNTPERLNAIFTVFQKYITAQFPGMNVYLGNEIYYESDVPDLLAEGRVLTLNHSDYALIEFRCSTLQSQIITAVSEITRYGYVPIIAHVERYDASLKDESLIDELLQMGALIQVNADSVMGGQGYKTKKFCHRLLKAGKVHFIASDAHDTVRRPPLLRESFLHVYKKYGAEYAANVFYHNAQAVIENQMI